MYSVLVIDDEQMMRDVLQQALSRIEFNVETAEDALVGIEKFESGYYDLVITDICMPGEDGHRVLRHIRQSKRQETPVIGVSGTPFFLQESQFDDVLYKPFALQTLIEKAKLLMRQKLRN